MVYMRRGVVKDVAVVGAGVATPLAIEVATKGKRVGVGKLNVKQSALIGGTIGTLALVAGATETGVHGEMAEDATNYGAAALVTSAGLEVMSRMYKGGRASLQDTTLYNPNEIQLGDGSFEGLESGSFEGLESGGAEFGFPETVEVY